MSTAFADVAAVTRPRVSWQAILAGVVLAVAVELVLSLLGTSIGLGLYGPHTSGPDPQALGRSAGLWWVFSTIVALAVGSAAAARLAAVPGRGDGALHGLAVWSVTLLLTAYLVTSAVGSLIGGAFSVVGGTLSTAASGLGTAANGVGAALPQVARATGIDPQSMRDQVDALLDSPTPQDPAQMSRPEAVKAVGQALPDLVRGGTEGQAARQRITDIIAAQAHVSPDVASQRIDAAIAHAKALAEQAKTEATHAARVTAAATSDASLLAFFALVLGGVVAAAAGAAVAPHRSRAFRSV